MTTTTTKSSRCFVMHVDRSGFSVPFFPFVHVISSFQKKKLFLLGSSKFQLHDPYQTTFLRPDILLCTEDFKGKLN